MSVSVRAQPVPMVFSQFDNASLLLLDAQHKPVMSQDADKAMIPASTTKLITAFLALKHWGEAHRFYTDFYLAEAKQQPPALVIKGYGDPFLVSEEIQYLAKQLAEQLKFREVNAISGVVLDNSYFESNVILPGRSNSQNPYDAIPSAIAANFNTINVKYQRGKLVSAEIQTPLTSIAKDWGSRPTADLSQGRINLGDDSKRCEQYFAELLTYFLRQQGIGVGHSVKWHSVKEEKQELFYRHVNRRTLAEIIQPMMRYSTNFIANQLVLIMGAERYGAPATAEKAEKLLQDELQQYFNWQHFALEDGAGLSRHNRLSARQLVKLLSGFKPWRHLLPEVIPQVYAKSGTLIGVTTLAGYIQTPSLDGSVEFNWAPFALLINEPASYRVRNQIAQELTTALMSTSLVSAP